VGARALRQVRNVVASVDLHFCKSARTSKRNADKGRHMGEVKAVHSRTAHWHKLAQPLFKSNNVPLQRE
jgi:hypothetical protein